MSQFYDLASLVVIPSGYKASTIYAQKPLTTDGQLSFTRASTATRVNASGLIEAVASNVPRLDYLGSTCPRLLLEPQRTNLATFSESFNNAAWLKISATVTANTSVSPDGYASADTLTVSAGGYLYFQVVSYSAVSGQSVTLSLFAKNQINNFLVIGGATTSGTDVYIIENYGNGWYRHILTRTFTATASTTLQYIVATVGTHIIWGAQIEAGSYATSYIPTLGASVTRVADAASKTGISSLIGQTEGTIFIDFVWNNSLGDVVPFDITGSDGKLIWMRGIGAQFYGNGSTLLADIGRPGAVQGTRYKIAFVYGQNDFRLYRNGSLIGTDTSGTFTGTFSDIALNSVINQANAFNQILLFKTKLTNAQLAELTTL